MTPTATDYIVYYGSKPVDGQEELGLIMMLCLTGLLIVYFAQITLSDNKKRK